MMLIGLIVLSVPFGLLFLMVAMWLRMYGSLRRGDWLGIAIDAMALAIGLSPLVFGANAIRGQLRGATPQDAIVQSMVEPVLLAAPWVMLGAVTLAVLGFGGHRLARRRNNTEHEITENQ